jgi:hypothetical protein
LNEPATNLFHSDQSGLHCTIFKRKRQQVKRCLKTIIRELPASSYENLVDRFGRMKNRRGEDFVL